MAMRTIADLDPAGKRVLLRADLNVPLAHGRVADDTRIRATIPTIRALLDGGAMVAVCSHLGRPAGRDDALSLSAVAERLSELIGHRVSLAADCVGNEVAEEVRATPFGQALLLENVRFHPEEERNDPAFATALAAPFEAYVNDAFGAAHRAHASTEAVAHLLPAYAGLLLEAEVRVLNGLLTAPERPFLAIIGGAKVSTKIDVLRALVAKADVLAIGGGMANTFLAATGTDIKRSLSEPHKEDEARAILAAARSRGIEVLLPSDMIWSGDRILDIGPDTLARYAAAVAAARTVFWNGPLGMFEDPAFAAGTEGIARALAGQRERGTTTVIGGGESVQAVQALGLADRMTHVSTGGGAALELIEGKTLPGVAAIPPAAKRMTKGAR
ncbi:MAG TPA: phosphoglycerate kinase [Candidatus Limnocylindria bacterium]|jgi:phosphoglycerate kinase